MSERESSKLVTFTVTATKEQLGQLNKAWKGTDHMNRSQYVREIIMNYVNKKNNTQTNRY